MGKATKAKAKPRRSPSTFERQLDWLVSEAKAADYEYRVGKKSSALERLSTIRNFLDGFFRESVRRKTGRKR